MAQKQILPPNIRVDRNCQPTWVTQNAIPEEREPILLGGGHDSPPPYRHRVKEHMTTVKMMLVMNDDIKYRKILFLDQLVSDLKSMIFMIIVYCPNGLSFSFTPLLTEAQYFQFEFPSLFCRKRKRKKNQFKD